MSLRMMRRQGARLTLNTMRRPWKTPTSAERSRSHILGSTAWLIHLRLGLRLLLTLGLTLTPWFGGSQRLISQRLISQRLISQRLISQRLISQRLISQRSIWASNLAHAQSSSTKEKAILLITEGQRLLRASDFEGAIKVWRRAYSIYPEPKLLYYIAVTYGKINGACLQEERAWLAYTNACKDDLCRAKLQQARHDQFEERCYVQIEVTSPTQGAVIDWLGASQTLPFKTRAIRQRYEAKVSAPGHLSRWLTMSLERGELKRELKMDVPLVFIPRESVLSRHQTKILLGSAIAGILLSSFGGLQVNSARELRDSMRDELNGYPVVPNQAKQDEVSERVSYPTRLAEFESKQAWGVAMITLGVASLGVSVWSLFIKDPNREIIDEARRQGDLAQRRSGRSVDDESSSFNATLPHVLPTRSGAVLGWVFSF